MASVLPPPSMLVQPPSLVVVNQTPITEAETTPAAPATPFATAQITAAITKLDSIRSNLGLVTQGLDREMVFFRTDDDTDEDGNSYSYGAGVDIEDEEIAADLVILHLTIEPQLAILRDFLRDTKESNAALNRELVSDDFAGTRAESTMALVHAINGGAV